MLTTRPDVIWCDQHFRPPKRHSSVSIRGLKFWSPYVCPIWVRPEFQAAKATQLGVNSKLFAQKSRGAIPNLGYPFCRLLVESCDDPPKKAGHMSAVATKPKIKNPTAPP